MEKELSKQEMAKILDLLKTNIIGRIPTDGNGAMDIWQKEGDEEDPILELYEKEEIELFKKWLGVE